VNLRRRVLLLASALVLSLIGLGALGVQFAEARSNAAARDRSMSRAEEQSLRLTSAYVDMETGQRGYIIGGDEVFLEPYRSGANTVTTLEKALLAASADWSGPTRQAFDTTIDRGAAWRAQADAELKVRRSEGRAAAEAEISRGEGKQRFDAFRSAAADFSRRLGLEQEQAAKARERRASRLSKLLLAIPLVALMFTVVGAWLLTRWVVRPLGKMLAAVRSISAGEAATALDVRAAPDVQEVGRSIDEMRVTITERIAEAQQLREIADRSRETVEQSATLTLQLRNELATELGTFPAGWTAAASLLPAEGLVAGDCYDVTLVSPHQMGIIVVDIAGHGATQAIIALRCKEILRAALRMGLEPGRALGLLSEQVGDLFPSFVTAFVAVVNTITGDCHYANAGHPPALLADHDRLVNELGPTGPLLGVFDASWTTAGVVVGHGGKLAVYTDGLTEARDTGAGFYGTERLAKHIVTLPCEVAESVITSCLDDLQTFRPARLDDDVTMVLVCRECV
jgi:serine phosphatase RsbU (regulator of sigma subunit)/CHASE3 domain sensor protein